MPRYYATFTGRKLGAIGIMYPIATVVTGNSVEEAELNLYKEFDCVHRLKLVELMPEPSVYQQLAANDRRIQGFPGGCPGDIVRIGNLPQQDLPKMAQLKRMSQYLPGSDCEFWQVLRLDDGSHDSLGLFRYPEPRGLELWSI